MPECRFCGRSMKTVFADLGMSPLSNAFVRVENAFAPETFYPLTAFVCDRCYLVQLPAVVSPREIFSEYAYFSSFSDTWLEHSATYVSDAIERFELDARSQVIEVASNDGYLLQYFVRAGIPVLGIEPARNVAGAAIERGVPTRNAFFGTALARELVVNGTVADLLIGNNVLAHVPDLNDFVEGLKTLLGPAGVITMEFPHLLRLIDSNEFDTIYHEHFSYFSLQTVVSVFEAHGLTVFDVDELPTHGGSLRIYARHAGAHREVMPNVSALVQREESRGLRDLDTYARFDERIRTAKNELLTFLIEARKRPIALTGPADGLLTCAAPAGRRRAC